MTPRKVEREKTITLTLINEDYRQPRAHDLETTDSVRCSICGRATKLVRMRNRVSLLCPRDGCTGEYAVRPDSRNIRFTCFLSFLAKREDTYIPPFLPFFTFEKARGNYEDLKNQVSDLGKNIAESYPHSSESLLDGIAAIGEKVFRMDGRLQKAFNYILGSGYESLVIFTNDASIPWHWTYSPDSNQFLLDQFSCGTIFVDRIDETLDRFFPEQWEAQREVFRTKQEALNGKKVMILAPLAASDRALLPHATSERDRLHAMLTDPMGPLGEASFNSEDVVAVPMAGSKARLGDQVAGLMAKESFRDSLELIHFSGHIISEPDRENERTPVLAISQDAQGWVKASDFLGSRLQSEPLLFLNGCFSGEVFDVWDKSANLATALLNKGAAGCVVTTGLVEDERCSRIAEIFYQELLSAPESVTFGEALLSARQQLRDEDSLDPMRFMFHFYGDPDGKMIYISAPTETTMEFMLSRGSESDHVGRSG